MSINENKNKIVSNESFFINKNTFNVKSICKYIFRCQTCKEALFTQFEIRNKVFNIKFNCTNKHFGSIDINVFLKIMEHFSELFFKCTFCEDNNTYKELYICKDCEEILCKEHAQDCIEIKSNVISLKKFDYFCNLHNKPYLRYCLDCKKNICLDCISKLKHKSHSILEFENILLSKEKIEKINIFLNRSKDINNKLKKDLDFIKDKLREINKGRAIKEIEAEIEPKIKLYKNQILYASYIEKAYIFCTYKANFNYQIISNFDELCNTQNTLIENTLKEIEVFIFKITQHLNSIQKITSITSNIKEKESYSESSEDKDLKNYNENKIEQSLFSRFNLLSNNIISNSLFFKDKKGYLDSNINNEKNTEKIRYKSAYYIGPIKNKKKEGFGKLIFDNKEIYEGDFKEDKIDGNGLYIFSNGDQYKGEFLNGAFNGKGMMKYKSGAEYIGEFVDGKMEGQGKYLGEDGGTYEGHFIGSKRDGIGISKTATGERYEGFWKDDKKDGKGKYYFVNKDFYEGNFKEDMFDGEGVFFYSDGKRYAGTWKNNKRNGRGVFITNKGEVFSRTYENNTLISETKMCGYLFVRGDPNFNNGEKLIDFMNEYFRKIDSKKK